jgi:hypothetical protein
MSWTILDREEVSQLLTSSNILQSAASRDFGIDVDALIFGIPPPVTVNGVGNIATGEAWGNSKIIALAPLTIIGVGGIISAEIFGLPTIIAQTICDSLEHALEIYLRSSSTLSALIGEKNVFHINARSGQKYPYITFGVESDERAPYRLSDDRAGQPKIQFDIWARDKYKALEIGNELITILQFYKGKMYNIAIDWIRCSGVQVMRDDSIDDLYHGIVEANILYILP